MNRSTRRGNALKNAARRSLRIGPMTGLFVALAFMVLATTGCEDDTTPVITKLSVTPQCGVIEDVPPGAPGNATGDTLRYLEVTFFARATSGNGVNDPTGANSPLEWRWDFDGNGSIDATNDVNPRYRYTVAGTYEARLEVEDDDGDLDTKTILVEVREESTELDILQIAAESRSEFRLVPTGNVNNGLDEENMPVPIDELPLDERFVFSSQDQLAGWRGVFDGVLTTGCSVSEVFSQFDWVWDIAGRDPIVDLNPIAIDRNPSEYSSIDGTVTVTEVVSGASRSDDVTVTWPTGVIVRNGTYFTIAPGATDDIDIVGLMVEGTSELDFAVDYDAANLTVSAVDLDTDLSAAGLVGTADTATPGRIAFSFRSDPPVSGSAPESRLATISFTLGDDPLDETTLRPIRVRNLSGTRPGAEIPLLSQDGFIRQDVDDCNDNALGDTMELLARGTFIDITGEGQIDYCGDCDENGTIDGVDLENDPLRDIDANRLPDDCDCNSNGTYDSRELAGSPNLDLDANGRPDDCDCDWDGVTDLDQIRNESSFTPQFDPETGLVVSYFSDLDALGEFGPGADLTLDFCQDCDENGTIDTEQFTTVLGDGPAEILAKGSLDIDLNDILDECDCNSNGYLDRGEMRRDEADPSVDLDVNNDGILDECDCDSNGIPDLADIIAGEIEFDVTAREGNAPRIDGYSAEFDINGDVVLDRCADCNDNMVPDGTDIAQANGKLDVDLNGLPDTCDCNLDNQYDPAPDPATNDANDDGIIDTCDCDENGVADLEQIAEHPSTVFQFSGSTVIGYTSDIDVLERQVTVVDGNNEITIVDGQDSRLDVCQDCNRNGFADSDDLSGWDRDPNIAADLDQNRLIDDCDCNGNGKFDTVDLEQDPGLDGDDDDLIDSCDCNNNGEIDLVEMREATSFDPLNPGIYQGSSIDTDRNLVLDECQNMTNVVPAPARGDARRR